MCVDHSKLQTKVLKESRFLSNHPIYHPDCDHSTFEVFLWTRPELEMIVGIENADQSLPPWCTLLLPWSPWFRAPQAHRPMASATQRVSAAVSST
jgi:hypothetical protein